MASEVEILYSTVIRQAIDKGKVRANLTVLELSLAIHMLVGAANSSIYSREDSIEQAINMISIGLSPEH